MTRVLLIEDNADLAFAVTQAMELDGYDVEVAPDGERGTAAALRDDADLIVLDIMLPGVDGFRVLRRLRDAGVDAPVLVLTARGEEEDKLRGFRLGADDYLTKPFGVRELLARVEVLLRRRGRAAAVRPSPQESVRFGDIEVVPAARLVRRQGVAVPLRPREMDLLLALVAHDGRVVTRQQLLRDVWSYSEEVSTRTIDIHMVELRRKLEPDPANPRHIVTVRKMGYRLDL